MESFKSTSNKNEFLITFPDPIANNTTTLDDENSTIVMKHCHRFVSMTRLVFHPQFRNSVHEYSTANTEEEKKIKKLSLLSHSNL